MLAKIYGDPAMSDIAPKTATEMALDAVAMQYDKMLIPDGSLSITENGTYNVADKETAEVNVPNPSTGSLSITTNGTHNVKNYASAEVNVNSLIPRIGTVKVNNGTGMTAYVMGGYGESNGYIYNGGQTRIVNHNNANVSVLLGARNHEPEAEDNLYFNRLMLVVRLDDTIAGKTLSVSDEKNNLGTVNVLQNADNERIFFICCYNNTSMTSMVSEAEITISLTSR